ncbi:RDD family protein [Nocardioides sp. R-C-SC26]|uniref:RDD family protein n=1 Tax=Nocardioides sp. R-C-SC26 TaxID=2870414 RepID=UPI001E3C53E3|nr:RDD family protein [Nocardioides sp. R-C-SC26]
MSDARHGPALRDALPFETASWFRRIAALFIDWAASTFVVVVFVGWADYSAPGSTSQFAVLPVFVLESALFTWLLAGSFGKLVVGLRTIPADGRLRPLNPLTLLGRQVLVALVIPPLVFRPDGRGLHDLMIGTATVRVATFRALLGR